MTIDMTSHHALECRGSWGGPTTGRTATSPWDQTPGTQTESPRSGGDSDLRVSDAERQATADQLKAHFTAGRLDMDEYDERLQRALSARTGRDLHDLMRDLPSESTAPTQPPRPRPLFVPALIAITVLAVLTMASGIAHGFFFPWWIIPIGFFLLSRHWRRRWHAGYWGPAR